jgi:hypothetical protein
VRKILVLSVVLFVMVFLTGASNPAAHAEQRPIENFVDAQGTYCFPDGSGGCLLFVPPLENFLGWTDLVHGLGISVDYAGLADDFTGGRFGTEFSGNVTERPLPDGRAEVHVRLHTRNALTWVLNRPDFLFPTDEELLLGYLVVDTDENSPALADSFLDVKFINTAPGDPLPDLIQLLVEEPDRIRFIAFTASAKGPLRELFGVPDGTPGRAKVVQTGLFMTPGRGAVADGFPAERIELHVVGQ